MEFHRPDLAGEISLSDDFGWNELAGREDGANWEIWPENSGIRDPGPGWRENSRDVSVVGPIAL